MTETSYFWNGTVVGDALLAPYSAKKFSEIVSILFNASNSGVIPGVGNHLEVVASSGRSVEVTSGAALLNGVYYENVPTYPLIGEKLFLDENNGLYPRYDRIVVRYNKLTQEVFLAVIRGVPDLKPEPPIININENYVELPLARIYIPVNYTSTSNMYIFDERVFINNFYHQQNYSLNNLFFDSALTRNNINRAYYSYNNPNTIEFAPDNWFSDVPEIAGYNAPLKNDIQTFVNSQYLGYSSFFGIRANNKNKGIYTYVLFSEYFTVPCTFKMHIKVITGTVKIILGSKSLILHPTKNFVEVIIRQFNTGLQQLRIEAYTDEQTEWVMHSLLFTYGFISATNNIEPKYVFLDLPLNACYMSETFSHSSNVAGNRIAGTTYSTGTYTLNSDWFKLNFPSLSDSGIISYVQQGVSVLYPGIKAFLVTLCVSDTGSQASNNCYAAILSPDNTTEQLRVDVNGAPNEVIRSVTGWITPKVLSSAEPPYYEFKIRLQASGTSTMKFAILLFGFEKQ